MSMGNGDYVDESQGEKDLLQLAEDTYSDYKDRFIPLENQLIENLSNLQDRKPQSAGRAAATTRQSFDKNYKDVTLGNTTAGYDPLSGKNTMGLADASAGEGVLQTRATTSSDQAVDDAYYSGQRQLLQMGQGIRSGSAGLSTISAGLNANAENIRAQSDAYGKNAMYGAVGTTLGLAGRAGLEKGWFTGSEKT